MEKPVSNNSWSGWDIKVGGTSTEIITESREMMAFFDYTAAFFSFIKDVSSTMGIF